MKKIISLFLSVILILSLLAVFSGCGTVSTDGLLEEAKILIEKSVVFNEIYYGEGIPYPVLSKPAIGNYYYADDAYLEQHGFKTIDELKEKTAEIFSRSYCEELYVLGFSGFSSANGFVNARYSSNQAENLRDENERLLVYKDIEPTVKGTTVYDFSQMYISEVGADYAYVALNITVNYPATAEKEAYSEDFAFEIRFVFERVAGCNGYDIGWRIDSPTY